MARVVRVARAGVVASLLLVPSVVAAQEIRPFEPDTASRPAAPMIAPDSIEAEHSNAFLFAMTGAMIGAGLLVVDNANCGYGELCFVPTVSAAAGALLGGGAGWMVGAIVDEWRRREAATD